MMISVIVRTVIMYFIMVAALRLMGKRQIAELQPSELVVTIMISNLATLALENRDLGLQDGLVPVLTLVGLDILMSFLTMRFPWLGTLLSGKPKEIIRNGRVDEEALKSLRFTREDLKESLRTQQVFDVSKVRSAVVETNGQVSLDLEEDGGE